MNTQLLCPVCNKQHSRPTSPNSPVYRCQDRATFDLGHFVLRGLPETDTRLIEARARVAAFTAYLQELSA